MGKGSVDRLYEKCGSLRIEIAELEERYRKAIDALREIANIGPESTDDFCYEDFAYKVLKELGEV